MRTHHDIESYLGHAGVAYEHIEAQGLWFITDPASHRQIAVSVAGGLCVFRVHMIDINVIDDQEAFFRALLEFNASDMIQGAYGVADNSVLLTCTLRLENLDYNEFQGVLDDFSIALSEHTVVLQGFQRA